MTGADANAIAAVDGIVADARALSSCSLPVEVTELAVDAVLDTVGVALAGAWEPAVDAALAITGGASSDGATAFGRPGTFAAPDAAVVNGTAAHALDYDDVLVSFTGHPTAPVLPPALALAETRGRSGADLVRAVVVGIEVETLFGEWLGHDAYARGWHTSASLGVFGAAAATAVLLDLDDDGWRHALGLAAVQSGGLRASFGTMAKPLQVGFAARAGLQAGLLAAAGATGPWQALSAAGFGDLVAGADGPPPRHGDRWRLLDDLFKFHACCYFTHSSILAVEEILARDPSLGERLVAVELEVSPKAASVCDRPRFESGLESKFSLQAATARVLTGADTADPASFTDSAAADPELRAAAARVRVAPAPALGELSARATLVTDDGERHVGSAAAGVPEPERGRRREALTSKFRRLAEPVRGSAAVEPLLDALLQLGSLDDVRQLSPMLSVSTRAGLESAA